MMVRTCSRHRTGLGWNLSPMVFGLVLSGAMGLSGCTQEALDPVHTVEWYKSHEAERTAMVTKCHNNPGQLASTPNCVNAQQAVSDIFRGQ